MTSSLDSPDHAVAAITQVLAGAERRTLELADVVASAGLEWSKVVTLFPDPQDILVEIARAEAAQACQPLLSAINAPRDEPWDIEAVLREFVVRIEGDYAGVVGGLVRVAITESAKNPDLRNRIHHEGPASVLATLRQFLQAAVERSLLEIDDVELAAEQLIGLLRATLYERLTPALEHPLSCGVDPITLFLRGAARRKGGRSV